jgi:hypothetical protein
MVGFPQRRPGLAGDKNLDSRFELSRLSPRKKSEEREQKRKWKKWKRKLNERKRRWVLGPEGHAASAVQCSAVCIVQYSIPSIFNVGGEERQRDKEAVKQRSNGARVRRVLAMNDATDEVGYRGRVQALLAGFTLLADSNLP